MAIEVCQHACNIATEDGETDALGTAKHPHGPPQLSLEGKLPAKTGISQSVV